MTRRAITLADAIVLIAAAAVSFWLARLFLVSDAVVMSGSKREVWRAWYAVANLVLLVVSLGVMAVRFLPLRPSVPRLARQPGFQAVTALVALAVLGGVLGVLDWVTFWGKMGPPEVAVWNWLHASLISVSGPWNVGFVIALTWFIGALQGFRRRRADWVEWAGRALGVVWVLDWVGLVVARKFWDL